MPSEGSLRGDDAGDVARPREGHAPDRPLIASPRTDEEAGARAIDGPCRCKLALAAGRS